jgi:tetratricopeptide (TPR) repeat protein
MNKLSGSSTAPSPLSPDPRQHLGIQCRPVNIKPRADLADKAIQELPTDATLHEFRALCLFALKDYKQAAATLYAVLAAGPGWDWDTMNYLYPDAATYTAQLRALEAYHKANPGSAEAGFVLAYHYLVLGHVEQAIKQLENVVRLLPESQLSTELLAALRAESSREAPQTG